MRGTSRDTGKPLEGLAHLRQSILDILSTPIGSRVMRRDYGSRLFELVDSPMNDRNAIEYISATADALRRWEPRIALQQVLVRRSGASLAITVRGRYLPNGQDVELDGLVVT